MSKQPNLILFGIDSLRADHMSLYGYHRLTTPHMDKLACQGAVFEQAFSPSIPTTPGYSSMFSGLDVFGTDVVALRHEGPVKDHVKIVLRKLGVADRTQAALWAVRLIGSTTSQLEEATSMPGEEG